METTEPMIDGSDEEDDSEDGENKATYGRVVAGALLLAVGIGLGFAVAQLIPFMTSQSSEADDVAPLAGSMRGACTRPKDFCNSSEGVEAGVYAGKFSFRDCDGDGIMDPYCEGHELLHFGYISSREGCENTWPNGFCAIEKHAGPKQVSNATHAAANEITIVHFNDVYSIAGVLENGMRYGGVSRLAHVVKQERARNPDRTFVVFAGDLLSPSVLSSMFEGEQMIDALNAMQVDAACLGNHEFDFGVDIMLKRLQESSFPWLNINLHDVAGNLLPHTTKYFVREVPWAPRWSPSQVEKVKVCFFGAAYDVRQTMLRDVDKVKYTDILEAAEAETKYLREVEKCHVVIPLTHQFANEDCKMSHRLEGLVDLILGGHDHTTIFDHKCGGAPVVKASADLQTQWVLTVWLEDDGTVQSVDGKLNTLTEADPFDVDLHNRVVEWEARADKELSRPIGCSSVDFDAKARDIRSRETGTGNFFADAMRSFHNTDVAMMNSGGIRGNKVYDAGTLTRKTLYEMHPFDNKVIKIMVSGKDLKEFISLSLDCIEDLCGNFVQISGMGYEFDPTRKRGERLVKLTKDGKEVADYQEYSLALTDYQFDTTPLLQEKPLYNMGTLNDAVPVQDALIAAVQEAGESCVGTRKDGRILNLGDSR